MLILIIVTLTGLSWYVNSRLKNKFRHYSQTSLYSGMSGAEAAARMLQHYRLSDVQITCVQGQLTDHYNPANKTVNLSEAVYYGRNAAAVAVASHECGHAVQHASAYSMLEFRSMLVPVQNISSKLLNIVVLGSFFGSMFLMGGFNPDLVFPIIILCYMVITLFGLVTLPVEIDASKRALSWIENNSVVTPQEYNMAKDALKWAGLTYLVSALGSLVMLGYYVISYLSSRD